METIIFATSNKAKLAQIRFVAQFLQIPIEVLSGRELYGDQAKYEEIGTTVGDIALSGARVVAEKIHQAVITEDTDLCVEALQGEPGIHAGAFLKDYGREGLLLKLETLKNRRASISSAVGLAFPDGSHKLFEHTVHGNITTQEQASPFPDWIAPTPENSFGGGFNAIFMPDGWNKTLAEISPEEAIPWSYRERNFVDVLEYISELS